MRTLSFCAIAAGLLMAADSGIRPRGTASDYPAHASADGITVAAAHIPPDQVKKLFATDLNSAGYIVFEVAIYPETGKVVDLTHGDFMLSTGAETEAVRAAGAGAVAANLDRKNPSRSQRGSDIGIYPSGTIGYESGPYDPVTGRRRPGGVYTSSGVGVGAGGPQGAPPRPDYPGRDRITMEQELTDKALPEGKVDRAVAGYVYFPKPSTKQKNPAYELLYYGAESKLRIPLK